jgi:hypothetical protein
MVRMAGEARVKKVRKRSCMFEFKFMVKCSWKAENWWRWRHGLQQHFFLQRQKHKLQNKKRKNKIKSKSKLNNKNNKR